IIFFQPYLNNRRVGFCPSDRTKRSRFLATARDKLAVGQPMADVFNSSTHVGRTAFVQPGVVFWAETQQRRMNFQEPEYILNEPWWVTVMGCVTLAAMFAFALIAV